MIWEIAVGIGIVLILLQTQSIISNQGVIVRNQKALLAELKKKEA